MTNEELKVRDWLRYGDVGLSSQAIASVYLKKDMIIYNHPYDPSDFGRCYRLLKYCPFIDIKIMRGLSDTWTVYVDHWDEMVKLWEEESPSLVCSKLYKLMQELRKDNKPSCAHEYVCKHCGKGLNDGVL